MRVTLLAFPLLLAACPGPMPVAQREPDEYAGCATDENWRMFDDRERTMLVLTDEAQAPRFLVPSTTSGTTFPLAGKTTLEWQLSPTVTGKPSGTAACTLCPTCGVLVPEHLPPVSGDVYDLQFFVEGAFIYRVLTSLQTFAPSDALWTSWRGKTVSLTAIRAQLKVNDVVAGPYKAASPITFSVGN